MAERLERPGAQPDLGDRACRGCRSSATASARTWPSRTPSWCARPTCTRMAIPASVRAIGRAGAGTNNIPVKAMSAARRAGVQRARRQRQRGQGTGARRHADGGAQPRAGAALRRRARRRRRPTSTRRSRTARSAFAGYELAGQHAGHHRPGQDRLPGRRCRHQAGHERARLRPRDHRRRRLEPALAGAASAASVDEVLQAARTSSPCTCRWSRRRATCQRRQHRPDAARRGAAELLAAKAWSTTSAVLDALAAEQLGQLRLRLSRRGAPRPRAGDRPAAPGRVARARPRTTAR